MPLFKVSGYTIKESEIIGISAMYTKNNTQISAVFYFDIYTKSNTIPIQGPYVQFADSTTLKADKKYNDFYDEYESAQKKVEAIIK